MLENIDIKRNNELLEKFKQDREYKKEIYKKCEDLCLILEELVEVIDDPIDKMRLKLYLKKVRLLKKKYYVPSLLELSIRRSNK